MRTLTRFKTPAMLVALVAALAASCVLPPYLADGPGESSSADADSRHRR